VRVRSQPAPKAAPRQLLAIGALGGGTVLLEGTDAAFAAPSRNFATESSRSYFEKR